MRLSLTTLLVHKTKLLVGIVALASIAFLCSIIRVALPGVVPSRMNVWIIVVCLKSIIVVAYELLSARYNRYVSPRANMILGFIEPLFWFTAFILSCMGVSGQCQGASCGLGAILIILALTLTALSLGLGVVSMHEWREFKGTGKKAGLNG